MLTPDGRVLDAGELVPDWSGVTLETETLAAEATALAGLAEMPAMLRFGVPVAPPGKVVSASASTTSRTQLSRRWTYPTSRWCS